MASTGVTVDMIRNDNRTFTLTFTDENGAAIDITGFTCFFTVKENMSDSDDDAKIKQTWSSHSDPTNGESQFSLIPADTASLSGMYYFDVQIKDLSSKIYTTMIGYFNIVEDVTLRTSA